MKVILIPSIADYKEADLHNSLWWKLDDFKASFEDMLANSNLPEAGSTENSATKVVISETSLS